MVLRMKVDLTNSFDTFNTKPQRAEKNVIIRV